MKYDTVRPRQTVRVTSHAEMDFVWKYFSIGRDFGKTTFNLLWSWLQNFCWLLKLNLATWTNFCQSLLTTAAAKNIKLERSSKSFRKHRTLRLAPQRTQLNSRKLFMISEQEETFIFLIKSLFSNFLCHFSWLFFIHHRSKIFLIRIRWCSSPSFPFKTFYYNNITHLLADDAPRPPSHLLPSHLLAPSLTVIFENINHFHNFFWGEKIFGFGK